MIEAAEGTTPDIEKVEVVDVPKPTLRDTIEQAIETTVAPADDKGERPRDSTGKFLPKEAKAEPLVKDGTIPDVKVERKPPPSSWKKDYHEFWNKAHDLDPKGIEYLLQREQEFAKGVSTYKTEFEAKKAEFEQVQPIVQAIAPFMNDLKANNIQPSQWISNLGNAHKQLAMGSPEQKLGMFLKLAQDYQVPVQQLFQQGQDGKIYFNPQVRYQAPVQQTQPDIGKLVEQKFLEVQTQNQIQEFEAEATKENSLYPHYATVKPSMAQLLEAGIATDLKGAYEAALRLPQHSEIFDQMLKTKQENEAKELAARKKEEAERARRSAVSVRGSTPNGKPANGTKGIRAHIEAAMDEHEGRV